METSIFQYSTPKSFFSPINLNDGNTNPERFKLIKYPEDFTATLNQLVDETYWAFQKADGGMFDIELNTRDVEIYTTNAVKVLFMVSTYIIVHTRKVIKTEVVTIFHEKPFPLTSKVCKIGI